MCGIAGKVSFSKTIHESELMNMQKALSHRGPDDRGMFISEDQKVGLAHTRLAIIDLSKKAHQPMSFDDKRYWISFNGEVYNYQEERAKLEKKGYKFYSKSDTEVILALYKNYGVGCLQLMRGMFAFAIYDDVEKTLFLVRDRIGKKPLKYFTNGEVFLFASELKAILTQPEVKTKPDFNAIYHYLTYGYVPYPRTGFLNIQKLEPAHYLMINIKNRKITKVKYWQPDFSNKLILSEKEWCKRILEELEESTRLRMIADVPVGAFLSGGTDSSAVVAMMAGMSNKRIKTFNISFKEHGHDESSFAKNIARKFNTDHTEFLATPATIDLLPELIKHYEEPFADNSSLITYIISQMARKKVTVALNGDGGDENFAGYPRHFRLNRDVQIDKFNSVKKPLARLADWSRKLTNETLGTRSSKFWHKSQTSLAYRYISYNSYFLEDEKQNLLTRKFLQKVTDDNSCEILSNKFTEAGTKDGRDQALYADISMYLPEDLLVKVDMASMRVGLESRSPFIDHKMVELAAQIPFDLKIKNGENKYILKKALENIVPKENLFRPKMGFTIPLSLWFKESLLNYTRDLLTRKSSLAGKIFNADYIEFMLSRHSLKQDYGMKLWSLLTLELWWQAYFG